jgi:hypothetical protein
MSFLQMAIPCAFLVRQLSALLSTTDTPQQTDFL